jgi:hypothetical protein
MAPQIELPRIAEPANEADVMREQLEYLIGHATSARQCGCADCKRYLRARATLLEIFEEPTRPTKVREIAPRLARAA